MTKYEKIAISLPSRAAEQVRRAVKDGRAASASAYIAGAIQEQAAHESLGQLLDRMLAASGGPLSDAERDHADMRLGIAPVAPRRGGRRTAKSPVERTAKSPVGRTAASPVGQKRKSAAKRATRSARR